MLATLLGPAAASEHDESPLTSGRVKIGLQDTAFPFSYVDRSGQRQGYARAICLRALDRMRAQRQKTGGKDLTIDAVSITSSTRLPMLLAHQIDLECGSTTNTEARARLGIGFSRTIFVSGVTALVRRDPVRAITRFEDVLDRVAPPAGAVPQESGRKFIVTTEGSTSIRYLRDLALPRPIEVKYGQTHEDSFQQLVKSPDAVAFVMDEALLRGQLAAAPPAVRERFEVLRGTIHPVAIEHYGIMFRKSDKAFGEAFSAAMTEMYRSGEMERLYEQWFQSAIPAYRPGGQADVGPASLVLGLPLSDALRQIFQTRDSEPSPTRQ